QYPDRSISDSDFLENEINSESVTEQAGVDGCELASGFITGIGHGPAGDPGVAEMTEGRTDGFGCDEDGVVTDIRVHGVIGDSRARSPERLRERCGLLGRKMPVAGKTHHERSAAEIRECVGCRRTASRQVVVV